jgi:hypothetical protein
MHGAFILPSTPVWLMSGRHQNFCRRAVVAQFDILLSSDSAPVGHLCFEVHRKRFRRTINCGVSGGRQLFLHVGQRHDLGDLSVQLFNDAAGRPPGQQYPIPEPNLAARNTRFLQGRHVGKLRGSLFIGDSQQPKFSFLYEGRDEREGDCQNLSMSGDRRVDGRRTALEWNVDDIGQLLRVEGPRFLLFDVASMSRVELPANFGKP